MIRFRQISAEGKHLKKKKRKKLNDDQIMDIFYLFQKSSFMILLHSLIIHQLTIISVDLKNCLEIYPLLPSFHDIVAAF